MLVSARRIGVPRKTERSDVLWGERLADLFKDNHTPKCRINNFCLKNRKTAICKSLTLMKILCKIFFCDTNNVGIGIYNASAVQDKAPNKMLSANDDRNDSSDIETCD